VKLISGAAITSASSLPDLTIELFDARLNNSFAAPEHAGITYYMRTLKNIREKL